MSRTFQWILCLALTAVAVAGCRSRSETPSSESTGATTASPGSLEGAKRSDSTGGMMKMPGMSGMMSMAMMDSMQASMRRMNSMSPDQMKSMLPAHRQMLGNMLSQMNSEMRSMNMSATPAWNALVDSVRQDLIRMPEMNSVELETMMPAHHGRVTRLMELHQHMMGGG